ncbi:hypothetical protein K431DRAFT_292807 [Polychaeton citri CBS 116435]|uniref:Uncharacterized protein n=1 Tax=Polychaeton citri CBS 116435 TaxID=1314669 RepID=A0A9P4QBE3_9PEZI|nr:hypothetical protein K431DRAFT_292807 [Polychaeton citri CBS 116435]
METPPAADLPAEDRINRTQECQDLLLEIKQMSRQREENIRLLAVCDGIAEERQRTLIIGRGTNSSAAIESIGSTQVQLENHRSLVTRHLKTIEKLQLAQRELILDLLMDTLDPSWYKFRRKNVVAAFQLANDVHLRIMRKSMMLSSLVRESDELSKTWESADEATNAECNISFEFVRSVEQPS